MTLVSPLRSFGFLLIILLCFSCSNEIQLFPEEMESALMVYGILDANSDNQYVKIRKTFGGNSDLEGMAGDADRFNPPGSLLVRIDEWTDEGINSHQLIRSQLEKDPGIFSTAENVIYKGSFLPYAGKQYDLFIEDTASGEIIMASTHQIAPPVVRFPLLDHTVYSFADTLNPFYVKYVPSGSVHLQQFFINYIELLNSGDTLYKTVNFELNPIFKHPRINITTYTRTYHKDYVINIIRMLINEDEDVKERQLHSFDIVIWAGDEYLKDYLQLANQFNDNRRQFFSNIDGGMGIFAAAAHTNIEGIWPRSDFYDTLALTSRLEHLKFSAERFIGEFHKRPLPIPEFNFSLSNQIDDGILPE